MLPFGSKDNADPKQPYTEEELAILDKLAKKVVAWKMAVPAIMTLESVKPINYVSSQAMVFFEPIVQSIFNFKDYDTFRAMLERRETIEMLLLRVEHYDAIAARKEKLIKKLQKDYLKAQSWGFRLKSSIFGFRVPQHLEAEWKAKLEAIDAEYADSAPNAQTTEGKS